jgi:GNAT superfamily N-acetyltransferase
MSTTPEITIATAGPSDLAEMMAIDDDACAVFANVGMIIDLAPDHPFALAERSRWLRAATAGDAYFARDGAGQAVGLLVMGHLEDGAAYLDQLSVRARAARQGIGRQLLQRAFAWAGPRDLWLTTYAHVPWNRPFYERAGFRVEAQCPADVLAALNEQRAVLPDPDQRIAMVRRPP